MSFSLVHYIFRLYFYCQYADNNILLSKVNIMTQNCVVKFFYKFCFFTFNCDKFRDIFYNSWVYFKYIYQLTW